MGQTLLFAATFLPSFLIGRVSGNKMRELVASLLPDTYGGMFFFLAIIMFAAMTVDGVVGQQIPDYLHQPISFLMTGFGSGIFLALLRGMFRPAPTPPPAILPERPRFRGSSAIPPEEFWVTQR